jgi:WhiB family redox-sensing transcriptional regulator
VSEHVFADTYGAAPVDYSELIEVAQRRPEWHADAACREHPEVTWFPERGENAEPAKAICAGCLVVEDCRAWSLEQGPELDGIWGGLSQRERRKLRSTRLGGRRAA